jgi:hypothetical protein
MYGQTSAGVGRPPLIDGDRKLVTVPGGGKYAEAAMAGRLFYAANINMVATSTTLNTTFVGLGLCNPTGSGKNVIVHEFGYAFVVAFAAAGVLALATTTDSGFADDVNAPIKCTRNGYATSVCYTDEGATIVAPVIVKVVSQFGTNATTAFATGPQIVDLGGSIILAPGRSLVTDTTTVAGASSAQFSFMWEEIDV